MHVHTVYQAYQDHLSGMSVKGMLGYQACALGQRQGPGACRIRVFKHHTTCHKDRMEGPYGCRVMDQVYWPTSGRRVPNRHLGGNCQGLPAAARSTGLAYCSLSVHLCTPCEVWCQRSGARVGGTRPTRPHTDCAASLSLRRHPREPWKPLKAHMQKA